MHTRMTELKKFKDITFDKLDVLFDHIKDENVSNDVMDDLNKAWDILAHMAKCHHYSQKTMDPQIGAYMAKMKDLSGTGAPVYMHTVPGTPTHTAPGLPMHTAPGMPMHSHGQVGL